MGIATQKFIDSIESSCKNLYSFKGRTNRYDYFAFTLVVWGLGYIFGALTGTVELLMKTNWIGQAFNVLWTIALLVPIIGITVRRLHDVGRKGWWLLLGFTGIGILLPFYWTCKRSKPTNKYGELLHHPDAGLGLMLIVLGLTAIEIVMFLIVPFFLKH